MGTLMKKVGIIIILILAICLALTACNGNGKEKIEKTIEIKTIEDLKEIKDYLGDEFSLYTYELKNDLDLSEENWIPIGESNQNSFRATFKGNGHTISGLTIKGAEGFSFQQSIPFEFAGLFGYIYNATIENLNLTDFDISFFAENDHTHIGGLVGFAYGENTIKDINVSGKINMGTSFYLRQRTVLMETTCDQTQYFGGLIGYSSGKLSLNNSVSDVEIDNLIGSRGPKYDLWEEAFVYEKDNNGEDTDIIVFEVLNSITDPEYFPQQAFVGGMIGLAKGRGTELVGLEGKAKIPNVSSKSAYLGGLFGSTYQANISSVEFSGNIGTRVFVKGVSGGIAGLIDETTIINAEVSNSEISLNVSKSEYQAYTSGGIVGYANDFSVVQNSKVINTIFLSNLVNVVNLDSILNYPVIGGIAGTIRDSGVYDCEAEGGGVYRYKTPKSDGTYQYIDIDEKYIFAAGMVADVYGNSTVTRCKSSFKAYTGAIGKATQNVYVEENGKRILRFTKEGKPKVYVGIDAFVESGVLKVNFIDEAGDIAATKTYTNFTGTNIEEYSQNYYDLVTGRLVDENGMVIIINGKTYDGFERLTGMYSFSELDYLESSVIVVGEDDIDSLPNWKRAVI